MSIYIQSWRRKAGWVTLAIAALFASLWIQVATAAIRFEFRLSDRCDSVIDVDASGIYFEQRSSFDEYGAVRGTYLESQFTIPHFIIVIPLALISAGLLFAKPTRRQS